MNLRMVGIGDELYVFADNDLSKEILTYLEFFYIIVNIVFRK